MPPTVTANVALDAALQPDAFLVLLICIVLVFTPIVAALALGSYLRLDWGNPLFFLVPLTLLLLIPLRMPTRAVARAGIRPDEVETVVMGNVVQAGEKMNPARQAGVHAGLPVTTPASRP